MNIYILLYIILPSYCIYFYQEIDTILPSYVT